ncbi:MAG: SycD/LcrH family type III secretion system chaperone [Planctomycetota bacterium]|jgi:type III secretion system low calcium response chaperone LcrH/SycD|nr:SycD/LcrH family type III secretion system chaperone [Planctomycetota bacterium]
MTATNENEVLERVENLVKHFSEGGTLGTMLQIGDEELEAIYAVAYSQYNARKYDKAIDLFKFLCLYDHNEARWFYGLGVAQQAKREYAAAVNSYAVATLLDVDDPRPQTQAGYCLLALERWQEAQSALEGALMACGQQAEFADIRRQAEALLTNAKAKNPAETGKKGEK